MKSFLHKLLEHGISAQIDFVPKVPNNEGPVLSITLSKLCPTEESKVIMKKRHLFITLENYKGNGVWEAMEEALIQNALREFALT